MWFLLPIIPITYALYSYRDTIMLESATLYESWRKYRKNRAHFQMIQTRYIDSRPHYFDSNKTMSPMTMTEYYYGNQRYIIWASAKSPEFYNKTTDVPFPPFDIETIKKSQEKSFSIKSSSDYIMADLVFDFNGHDYTVDVLDFISAMSGPIGDFYKSSPYSKDTENELRVIPEFSLDIAIQIIHSIFFRELVNRYQDVLQGVKPELPKCEIKLFYSCKPISLTITDCFGDSKTYT